VKTLHLAPTEGNRISIYLETLASQGLPVTADLLREFEELI
jgi:hypothetical protein